jgi:hypothetical protein
MAHKKFLVEIRLNDWITNLRSGGRVVNYEEVELRVGTGDPFEDLLIARRVGYYQFVARAKYTPRLSKLLTDNGQHRWIDFVCAPDAVEID